MRRENIFVCDDLGRWAARNEGGWWWIRSGPRDSCKDIGHARGSVMSMQDLRAGIRQVLDAVTTLRARFRSGVSGYEALPDAEREALRVDLEQLISLRIEVLNAFELLVRIEPARAVELLLRLYLGRGVSPDTKFGGFEFELSTMVDDLVEIQGAGALAELVASEWFDPGKLDDPRVLRSFSDALSCEPDEVRTWYRRNTMRGENAQ